MGAIGQARRVLFVEVPASDTDLDSGDSSSGTRGPVTESSRAVIASDGDRLERPDPVR